VKVQVHTQKRVYSIRNEDKSTVATDYARIITKIPEDSILKCGNA
jgi:hypothetical protein